MSKPTEFYIGIDPSLTNTGIVVLDRDLNLLKAESAKSKPPKVANWRADVARREAVNLAIVSYLAQWEGRQTILVEDYAINGMFARATIATVELGATLRSSLLLAERANSKIRAEFVRPTVIKKFIAGKGNATKLQVAAVVAKRYGVDFGGDDNLYDAYAIARLLVAMVGLDTKVTLAQRDYAAQVSAGFGVFA